MQNVMGCVPFEQKYASFCMKTKCLNMFLDSESISYTNNHTEFAISRRVDYVLGLFKVDQEPWNALNVLSVITTHQNVQHSAYEIYR